MGPQGLVDMVEDFDVPVVIKVFKAQSLFGMGHAFFGKGHGPGLFIHHIIIFLAQIGDDGVHLVIELGGLLRRAGDDQRGPGLVNEDGVHLVHDGEMGVLLDKIIPLVLHVIAQVVEPELVVGAVSDVRAVGLLALGIRKPVYDGTHGKAQKTVYLAHPLRVAAGQVVVDRHHVHASAREGVKVCGQRGHQGFPLTGFHFCNPALVQDHAADELDVEMAHVQRAFCRLPHHGKGLGKQPVQGGRPCPRPGLFPPPGAV